MRNSSYLRCLRWEGSKIANSSLEVRSVSAQPSGTRSGVCTSDGKLRWGRACVCHLSWSRMLCGGCWCYDIALNQLIWPRHPSGVALSGDLQEANLILFSLMWSDFVTFMVLWGISSLWADCCWRGTFILWFGADFKVFQRPARRKQVAECGLPCVWVVGGPWGTVQALQLSWTSKSQWRGTTAFCSPHLQVTGVNQAEWCTWAARLGSASGMTLSIGCGLGQPWDGFLVEGVHVSTLNLKCRWEKHWSSLQWEISSVWVAAR